MPSRATVRFLEFEARSLLTRLQRLKPFVLHETMVPAAGLSDAAMTLVERQLARGRRRLYSAVRQFIRWLRSRWGRGHSAELAHRRFTFLRLRFNAVLEQFDIFADALTQRSEHLTGIWLAGLDILAADALRIPGYLDDPPPVVCYLDRGVGAAIRRARTRLPGGDANPIALVRVPRERMVGSGVASSLLHEVGHQAASLLDLTSTIRPMLLAMQRNAGPTAMAWGLWERWISEILADFWALVHLGIGATMGLFAVVSLPRVFVFRLVVDDPHPFPWIRVKLGCALGRALYPDPQWQRLEAMWESFYPRDTLPLEQQRLLALLEATLPGLVGLLANLRPPALGGRSVVEVLGVAARQPAQLRQTYRRWRQAPPLLRDARPALVLAVIGQARADGILSPEAEGQILGDLLTHWALRTALATSAKCAVRRPAVQGATGDGFVIAAA